MEYTPKTHWTAATLQEVADTIWNLYDLVVLELISNHATRRELIRLLSSEKIVNRRDDVKLSAERELPDDVIVFVTRAREFTTEPIVPSFRITERHRRKVDSPGPMYEMWKRRLDSEIRVRVGAGTLCEFCGAPNAILPGDHHADCSTRRLT